MKVNRYYKIWSSARDGCCCPLCAKLEGIAVKYNEPFKIAEYSVMEPPLHDGCRCTVMYDENPEPQLRRDYDTLMAHIHFVNESDIFNHVVTSYFAAIYFLQRIIGASPKELKAAGLSVDKGHSLKDQLTNIKNHQDQIFNSAIKRAYKRELKEAKLLKTERGRNIRINNFCQEIVSTQVLSPANYTYLQKLIEGR